MSIEKLEKELQELDAKIENDILLHRDPILESMDIMALREHKEERTRGHLGMSQIGNPDDRTLWLQFRWCLPDDFSASTLRIFHFGHLFEPVYIDMLRRVKCRDAHYLHFEGVPNTDNELFTIIDADPNDPLRQINFSDDFGGHFAGSLDFIIKPNFKIAGYSTDWHVADIKTVNDKKFEEFRTKDFKEVSPTYYGQAQSYMRKTGLKRALYFFYNKNNSLLHVVKVKYDATFAQSLVDRAEGIIRSEAPPPSVYPNRSWYEIKSFKSDEYQRIYWGDQLPQKAHCRNCRFAEPVVEGSGANWLCKRHGSILDNIDEQLKGCDSHNWIPDLLNIPVHTIEDHSVTYTTKGGRLIRNIPANSKDADPAKDFNSKEFAALSIVDYDEVLINKKSELEKQLGYSVELVEASKNAAQ